VTPVIIGDATLYHGDCLEILPTLPKVDAVVTDPPYPDCLQVEYRYDEATNTAVLAWLGNLRAFVFWSAKVELRCNPSAIHIWDKKTGCGSQYERIYEINGQRNYRVFRHYLINSTVAAAFTGDEYTGHQSQKPISLVKEIVSSFSAQTVCDPFMGSGTTGVACANLGRKFIGIEIERKYFDIACERIAAAYAQGRLFA
jgi:DNA modification methylase